MKTIVFLFVVAAAEIDVNRYLLQKVLVLSRHNIRTPLYPDIQSLSPHKLVITDEPPGQLTRGGELMESYMGQFFHEWFKKEKLYFTKNPQPDEVYVLANNTQRTIKTAELFTKNLFTNSDIKVNIVNDDMNNMFLTCVKNTTKEFKESATNQVQENLASINVNESYKYLQELVDFKESEVCKVRGICDLRKEKNYPVIEAGKYVDVSGPLNIANELADTIIMDYYSGLNLDFISWNEIDSHQWELLYKGMRVIQEVCFNAPLIANDLGKPLAHHILETFVRGKPKLTVLVGHDSNLKIVITLLDFENYVLPNQYERTPIAGKLVFQKWHDMKLDRDLLKIDYVYFSTEQLRNSTKITNENPPQIFEMKLRNMKKTSDGFYEWADFVQLMETFESNK